MQVHFRGKKVQFVHLKVRENFFWFFKEFLGFSISDLFQSQTQKGFINLDILANQKFESSLFFMICAKIIFFCSWSFSRTRKVREVTVFYFKRILFWKYFFNICLKIFMEERCWKKKFQKLFKCDRSRKKWLIESPKRKYFLRKQTFLICHQIDQENFLY